MKTKDRKVKVTVMKIIRVRKRSRTMKNHWEAGKRVEKIGMN